MNGTTHKSPLPLLQHHLLDFIHESSHQQCSTFEIVSYSVLIVTTGTGQLKIDYSYLLVWEVWFPVIHCLNAFSIKISTS